MNFQQDFTDKLKKIIKFSKTTHDIWDEYASLMKLDEEFGELAEAILFSLGYMPHKTMKEKTIGEITDNIIQASCIYSYRGKDNKFFVESKFCDSSLLINELRVYSLDELIKKYHKDYSYTKNLFTGFDLIDFKYHYELLQKNLILLGFLCYVNDESIEVNDINEETVESYQKELIELIEFKLNKWKRNHKEKIENDNL